MKVLFAIRDEDKIVDSLLRKYKQDLKKEFTFKKVSNFTAIIKELQKNNSYDRIIIGDDIDQRINQSENKEKLILKKLKDIVTLANGVPIIYISRTKKILNELFDLKIYNALIGKDRTKKNIYELIRKPRIRKSAIEYYKIENGKTNKSIKETNNEANIKIIKYINYLNELELQNEKCIKKFEKIYKELTSKELAFLIKSLNPKVKKILKNGSENYNEFLKNKNNDKNIIETKKTKKIIEIENEKQENATAKKRGRPRKESKNIEEQEKSIAVKRGRGRPRKNIDQKQQEQTKNNIKNEEINKKQTSISSKQKNEKREDKNIKTNISENSNLLSNANDDTSDNLDKYQFLSSEKNNKDQNKKIQEEKLYLENIDDDNFDEFQEEDYDLDDIPVEENVDKFNDEDIEEENFDFSEKELDEDFFDFDEEELNLDEEDLYEDDLELDEEELDEEDLEENIYEDDLELDEEELDEEDLEKDIYEDDLELDEEELDEEDLEEDIYEDDLELDEEELDEEDLAEDIYEDDLKLDEEELDEEDLEEDIYEDDLELDGEELDEEDLEEDIYEDDLELDEEELDEEDSAEHIYEENLELDKEKLKNSAQNLNITEEKLNTEDFDINEENSDLYEFNLNEEEDIDLFDEILNEEDDDLLNLDDSEEDDELLDLDEEDDDILLDLDDEDNQEESEEIINQNEENSLDKDNSEEVLNLDHLDEEFSGIRNKNYNPDYSISKQISEMNDNKSNEEESKINDKSTTLEIRSDQKVIAFVGSRGSGTSFIINNLAQILSLSQGVKTAILDLTKNKNSYYIYTENEDNLRSIAFSCFEKLGNGSSEGIKVNKNLTVFTSLPNDDDNIENKEKAINTILKDHSIVLLDCDFETDLEYFKISQEIYLVQSLDILTIQPLTSFLKKLKINKIYNEEQIKILINKDVRVNTITDRMLISAMSVYNSPDTTYQLDLFNRHKIEYLAIPFEEKNYSKYLDELVKCKLSIRGYSKSLLNSFNRLVRMVYPLNNSKKNKLKYNNYNG